MMEFANVCLDIQEMIARSRVARKDVVYVFVFESALESLKFKHNSIYYGTLTSRSNYRDMVIVSTVLTVIVSRDTRMKRVVRNYVRRDSPACTVRASETPAYARKDGIPRLVIPESARILVTVRIL